ncbi:MAG TPA: cbb3-type cytochrome c oxidase subunit I [Myxococcaceae bacterium]|nr:cbb3-type cytochrome c oxidase subunit I [Myxococcaceae bacterium]
MEPTIILLSAFLLSVIALGAYIRSMQAGATVHDESGATVIFAPGEAGHVDDPAATPASREALQKVVEVRAGPRGAIDQEEIAARVAADQSTSGVVLAYFICAVVWLVLGSVAGLIASVKLHNPDWLTSAEWLTFGRIRTIHLNIVAYGWSAFAGGGLAIFLLPRLLRTKLQGASYAMSGLILWNIALVVGVVELALGNMSGLEWLEMPRWVNLMLAIAAGFVAVPLILTLRRRKVEHLYVSVWYLGLALFAFPVLFIVANLPGVHFGVQQGAMNWWYGHNVLGYFFTPLSLATIYYLLPKALGVPVYSYNLSLLAFWTLAFFYGQTGIHHLIGGPVPGWMVTLAVIQGVMMFIPVAGFMVNQLGTLKGHWGAVRHSPTLAFIVTGGIMYIAASFQGSLMSLRSVSTVGHFTHWIVAHAHLGNYGFVTIVFFGGIYAALPRILQREWPYPSLIWAHFWLVLIGFLIYFVGLSIGGWLQGLAMLDAKRPFLDSVALTIPWLKSRSVAGILMTLGHLVFAGNFLAMVLQRRRGLGTSPVSVEVSHAS